MAPHPSHVANVDLENKSYATSSLIRASELVHHRVTAVSRHLHTYTCACLGGRSSVLRRRDAGPSRGFEGRLDRVEPRGKESHDAVIRRLASEIVPLRTRGIAAPSADGTEPRAELDEPAASGRGGLHRLGRRSRRQPRARGRSVDVEWVLDEAMELAMVTWGARRRPPPPACQHHRRAIAVERPCATWTPCALPKASAAPLIDEAAGHEAGSSAVAERRSRCPLSPSPPTMRTRCAVRAADIARCTLAMSGPGALRSSMRMSANSTPTRPGVPSAHSTRRRARIDVAPPASSAPLLRASRSQMPPERAARGSKPRSERSSCANSRETHRGAFARTRRHGPPSASTWDVSGSSCESDATVPSPQFSRSEHAQCATSRGAASSGAPGRILSVPCLPSRPRGDRRDDGHVTSDRKSTTILRGRVGSIRATGGTSGGASARNRGASGAAVQWRERGG